MKFVEWLGIFFLLFTSTFSFVFEVQAKTTQSWVATYDGTASDFDQLRGLELDNAGNILFQAIQKAWARPILMRPSNTAPMAVCSG